MCRIFLLSFFSHCCSLRLFIHCKRPLYIFLNGYFFSVSFSILSCLFSRYFRLFFLFMLLLCVASSNFCLTVILNTYATIAHLNMNDDSYIWTFLFIFFKIFVPSRLLYFHSRFSYFASLTYSIRLNSSPNDTMLFFLHLLLVFFFSSLSVSSFIVAIRLQLFWRHLTTWYCMCLCLSFAFSSLASLLP